MYKTNYLEVPTVAGMREIVFKSLSRSKEAGEILKGAKYLGDVVSGYRYEQDWSVGNTLYKVVCQDVRDAESAIQIQI